MSTGWMINWAKRIKHTMTGELTLILSESEGSGGDPIPVWDADYETPGRTCAKTYDAHFWVRKRVSAREGDFRVVSSSSWSPRAKARRSCKKLRGLS